MRPKFWPDFECVLHPAQTTNTFSESFLSNRSRPSHKSHLPSNRPNAVRPVAVVRLDEEDYWCPAQTSIPAYVSSFSPDGFHPFFETVSVHSYRGKFLFKIRERLLRHTVYVRPRGRDDDGLHAKHTPYWRFATRITYEHVFTTPPLNVYRTTFRNARLLFAALEPSE